MRAIHELSTGRSYSLKPNQEECRVQEDKKPLKREITYQVGWKRGRMELGEHRKGLPPPPDYDGPGSTFWDRFMTRTIMRPIPDWPDRVGYAALWALPPVAFFLTWLLVFYLG